MKIISLLTMLVFAATSPFAQTIPKLTSYTVIPGVTPVIYLDFDGYIVPEGSRWAAYNGGESFTTAPAGFSSSEIYVAYQVAAEDFRPWKVAVTTDSAIYNDAPVNLRLRVVITTTWEWFGYAGGVAFFGSFAFGDDTPVWVFPPNLGSSAKFSGDCISHETGHALDLIHHGLYDEFCVRTSEYNLGYGDEETVWAPIMGASYYANIGTWDNGDSIKPLDCTDKIRDDIDRIGSYLDLKEDDHLGDPTEIPVTVSNSGINLHALGMIRSMNDEDAFTFTITDTTDMKLSVRSPFITEGYSYLNNLDVRVRLTGNGNTETFRPFRKVGVDIERQFAPGTYTIYVAGDGNEWMSDYGSLGNYEIIGNGKTEDIELWVDLGPDTSMCELDLQTQGYYLVADRGQNPVGTYYEWSTGETFDGIIYVDRPGVYWVRAFNENTSPQEAFDTVTISPIFNVQPGFEVLNYDSTLCKSWVTFRDISNSTCNRLVSVNFDFGDGLDEQVEPGDSLSHHYALPGNYVVRQTVTDQSGNEYEHLLNLTVYRPADPPHRVLGDDIRVCEGSLATLNPQIPNARWTWTDGYQNQTRNAGPGQYIIEGDLLNPETGATRYCDFRDTVLVISSPALLPDFEVRQDAFGTVSFVNKTSTCNGAEPSRYRWILGNGSESTSKNPVTRYSNVGQTITVTLTAFINSSSASVEKEITLDWLHEPFNRTTHRLAGVRSLKTGKGKTAIYVVQRPVIIDAQVINLVVAGKHGGEYQLLGVNGQLHAKGRLVPGNNMVSALRVPRGIFYIKIIGGDEPEIFRLVKW